MSDHVSSTYTIHYVVITCSLEVLSPSSQRFKTDSSMYDGKLSGRNVVKQTERRLFWDMN